MNHRKLVGAVVLAFVMVIGYFTSRELTALATPVSLADGTDPVPRPPWHLAVSA